VSVSSTALKALDATPHGRHYLRLTLSPWAWIDDDVGGIRSPLASS